MPKIIENIKENLILEGRKTLIEKSFKELSIREVASNCGIAIGTFYNYFQTKEAFASEIFKDDWKKTLNLADTLKDSDELFKEKLRKLYLSMNGFVDKYLSIFYEISTIRGYSHQERNHMNDIYIKIEEIISIEKSNGNINSELAPNKLAKFIVSNLIYLCKSKYITFDELYDQMNI